MAKVPKFSAALRLSELMALALTLAACTPAPAPPPTPPVTPPHNATTWHESDSTD